MKTLLVINSSIFGEEGNSARLTAQFVERWQEANPDGRVVTRDFSQEPVPHLSGEGFRGFPLADDERSPEQRETARRSDAYINELREADEVVIGLPMYNFGVPSQLKAWFDHVARAGVTFRYTASGPEGLIGDRKVTILATRGGAYQGTERDSQTRHVTDFLGLLGIQSIEFVYAERLGSPDRAEDALVAAKKEILKLAA